MNHEIEGMNELLKRLKDLEKEGEGMTEDILRQAVKPLKKEVEKRAPSYGGNHPYEQKYGKLKDNIEIEYDSMKETIWVTTGDSFWAAFQEYGTKSIKKNPFMEKSYLAKKKEVEAIIFEESKRRLGLQ